MKMKLKITYILMVQWKVLKNHMDQPNLVDMTKKSLEILSKNKNGFFAMIEGASIDKQLHAMDWQRAGYDTIEFDKAVEYARDWSLKRGDDTLIIVVADHAHGISITGTLPAVSTSIRISYSNLSPFTSGRIRMKSMGIPRRPV